MQNARMDYSQAGIKIAGRNINNFRYADDGLIAESEELKSLSMSVQEESEKVGLKLNIQKTKFMASGPINSWQTDGEKMETMTDSPVIFLGSKTTAGDDCSHEIKRHLLLGRQVKAKGLVVQWCLILCFPMDIACPDPMSTEFSRQEY